MWFLCCSNRVNENVTKKEPTYNAGLVCLGVFDYWSDLINQVKTEFINYPENSLIVYQAEFSLNLNLRVISNDDDDESSDLPW